MLTSFVFLLHFSVYYTSYYVNYQWCDWALIGVMIGTHRPLGVRLFYKYNVVKKS
jgi:hypothetical protein